MRISDGSSDVCSSDLKQKGFSEDELVIAGLVGRGRGLYDRFRGRLMWPIRDASGDTIGFGARRIFDDDRIDDKYPNTSERSEERREGQECVSTCRSWWSPLP